MAISIKAAFNNIQTSRYNRKNLALFFYLVLLGGLVTVLVPKGNSELAGVLQIISSVLYSGIIIFTCGFYYMAARNYLLNKPSILPDILTDYLEISLTALKGLVGSVVLMIIAVIAFFVAFIPCAFMPLLAFVTLPVMIFFVILLGTALYACFVSTFEISEWLNFSKAFRLIKDYYKSFIVYYFKCFLALLCMMVVGCIAILIATCIVTIIAGASSNGNTQFVSYVSSIIGALIGAFLGCGYGVLVIDITGQFFMELNPVSETIQEYIESNSYIQE